MFLCVCTNVCAWVSKRQSEDNLNFLGSYLCFWRWDLSLTWGSSIRLDCLGTQKPSCLPLPGASMTSMCHHAWLSKVGSGDGPQVLMLPPLAFANWAISPSLVSFLIGFLPYASHSKALSETFQDLHKKIIVIHHKDFQKVWNRVFSTGCYSSVTELQACFSYSCWTELFVFLRLLKVLFKYHWHDFSRSGLCSGTVCIQKPHTVYPARQETQWCGNPGLCPGQQEVQQRGNVRQIQQKRGLNWPRKSSGMQRRCAEHVFPTKQTGWQTGHKGRHRLLSMDKPIRKWVFLPK